VGVQKIVLLIENEGLQVSEIVKCGEDGSGEDVPAKTCIPRNGSGE